MRLIKQANKNPMVKVSHLEWYAIGKTAGWTTTAMDKEINEQLNELMNSANSEEVKKMIANLIRDKKDLLGQISAIEEKIRVLTFGIRQPSFEGIEQGRLPF